MTGSPETSTQKYKVGTVPREIADKYAYRNLYNKKNLYKNAFNPNYLHIKHYLCTENITGNNPLPIFTNLLIYKTTEFNIFISQFLNWFSK